MLGLFKPFDKASFVDYLRGGEQLNLMVAVDYTGSNGKPSLPTSLHYINPSGQPNQYETALFNTGDILLNYDYDGQVDCYGFGAFPNYPHFR